MAIKVAFVGLGVMGYPMAGWLSKKGYQTVVFNRTISVAERWLTEYQGSRAHSAADAAAGADFVFTCLGNDDDVREVVLAEGGVLSAMQAGAVLIDNSTVSANLARELDRAARAAGCHFIDAPVSGGQQGAQNGVLTVMCGGDADVFERARPVMESFARAVTMLGPAGSGQLC